MTPIRATDRPEAWVAVNVSIGAERFVANREVTLFFELFPVGRSELTLITESVTFASRRPANRSWQEPTSTVHPLPEQMLACTIDLTAAIRP